MLRRSFATAALTLAVTAASTGRADVIFNNFGAGDSYGTHAGWTIGTAPGIGTFVPSMAFTVPSGTNEKLSEIDFAAGLTSGTNSIDVSIRSDSGGTPGATLESWTVTGLGQFGNNNPPEVVSSVLHLTLLAGQQYWVTMTPGDSTTDAAWNQNSTGDRGPIYITKDGSPVNTGTNIRGVFRVLGTPTSPVPEPATLAAALVGALALAGSGWRRRRPAS
jgi:hypothetical protein